MNDTTKNNINSWLNGNYAEEDKAIIRQLEQTNPTELEDAFYRDLEFGTGGLRGIMGVGTNRMNKYTVAIATQGLCNYVKKIEGNHSMPKAAIAYDSRNNSRFFAEVTANVLTANGIETFLFDDIRPTPELSFAVRHLKCTCGIVITASHNPKEYNGYKVYWSDGAQLVPPHDENVIAENRLIKSIDAVKMNGNNALLHIIGKEIDELYIKQLKTLSLHPECIEQQKDLSIVYSPLHGTGRNLVPMCLKAFGFQNVTSVPEQAIADGNFPTVISPNPENAEALSMAISLAENANAELVLATDPDSDRVGIAVRNHQNEFILLNGNATASLIISYLCQEWKNKEKLNGKEFIVKTIVTTELLAEIAKRYNIKCYDVLTGFKYIAEQIRLLEGKEQFIGGGEESYGYLIGDFVRDKDAVISCSIIAEIAAWAKCQGKTLYDLLCDIYLQYGYYKESLLSITKQGFNGLEEIKNMMQQFRQNPPQKINNQEVVVIKDYQKSLTYNLKNGTTETINLPKSNVLQFFLANGSKITVRPSGTEPKIKFYFGVKSAIHSKNEIDTLDKLCSETIEQMKKDLGLC
ncbi:MAG: phospho-sugar mutase [Bacteroidales bacterium]|nr:phospho-sugar mutase [Bacteroidales bacterium]